MKINGIVVVLALSVAACQTSDPAMGVAQALTGGPAAPASGRQAAVAPGQTAALTFFDSSAFDSEMQDVMTAGAGTVDVAVAVPFSLNKIPPRMDKWLGAVKSGGGRVTAREDAPSATRSLAGIVMDVAVAMYDQVSERMQYVPATNYDATLLYRPGGDVSRVQFTRK